MRPVCPVTPLKVLGDICEVQTSVSSSVLCLDGHTSAFSGYPCDFSLDGGEEHQSYLELEHLECTGVL